MKTLREIINSDREWVLQSNFHGVYHFSKTLSEKTELKFVCHEKILDKQITIDFAGELIAYICCHRYMLKDYRRGRLFGMF
jgi:hypothetical protein